MKLWSCPGCGGWQTIPRIPAIAQTFVTCVELISCGEFCVSCKNWKNNHDPSKCVGLDVEDVSVFNKLYLDPDSVFETAFGDCKMFKLEKSEGNNPAALALINLAANIFNKKSSGDPKRFSIQELRYFENDHLQARFNKCKKAFFDAGIPVTEKLVFHGTSEDPISIFSKGFELHRVKRTAYGHGIYQTDKPSVALGYGPNLILSRVLIGNPYVGELKGVQPGYQCKMENIKGFCRFIVIDKEEQILPIFQLITKTFN